MYLIEIIFIFLFTLNINSLRCPIYNLHNNETTIDSCTNNNISLCTYYTANSTSRRCLGIYTFNNNLKTKENLILIRQLAFIDDFEHKYFNSTECILSIDLTGNYLFCRCNTNNCTLKWRTDEYSHNKYKKPIENSHENVKEFYRLIIIVVLIVIIFLSIIFLMKYYLYRNKKHKDNYYHSRNSSDTIVDEFLSSNLNYQSIISHGKNSTIYRTSIEEKTIVAIKIYYEQRHFNLFENELQILRIVQHSNIVKFLNYGWHGPSPYIIIEYHELGSLNTYLSLNKLPWSTCYSFFYSILDAVDYLHYEELSSNDYLTSNRIRKPIIIHRDIKSCNIVVKSYPNLSLCLIDFGLAKILPSILTADDFIQIGTYRYMAPELLELAISHTSDALCKVDMYALGLVLWEIITQCQEYPYPVDYQLPYAEYIDVNVMNENKILDVLHRIVVNERKRPLIHRTKDMNSKISNVLTIIEDCWKHEPESRVNARPALYRLKRLE